ncbi:MAG TPA: oxalate/formate MFS antiporter [Chloroflexota bacterium]|nr:oxalate/formate MFS antiporter [Chloroflexota bacterium]
MATSSRPSAQVSTAGAATRWIQLVAGIVGMVAVANLQYGWTLFVNPIDDAHHWGKAAIQVAFTIFVLAETWLVPVEAYLVDRFGPRLIVAVGGVLVAVAWSINAMANSLALLYVGGAIGGIGAGIVYGTTVGNALKWFQDRRGLAAGLTAAGFGAGSALTVVPIANMIKASGYQSAFLWFGLGQGLVVLLAACFLRVPRPGEAAQAPSVHVHQSKRDFTPVQAVKTPVFWLLYAMFTLVAMGGLMATAQLAVIATDYKVADIPVSMLGLTMAALPFALSLDRILNGVTRPFFGWVSDHIGRENTMFLAFGVEGIAILALVAFAQVPLLFVLLTGLAFFAWGEIYSLFPATSADLFGRQYATTNYGLLYTAKGTASLLVPIGSIITGVTGSWLAIFVVAAIFNFAAALLALFVLKPVVAHGLEPAAAAPAVPIGISPAK